MAQKFKITNYKMAEIKDHGGKIQIVFLIDVYSTAHAINCQDPKEICQQRCEAISLSVLRFLLFFNSSDAEYWNRTISWGFKFYNSSVLNFEYKQRRFYELDSQSFERFEKEMKEKFGNVLCGDGGTVLKQNCAGSKALSCSLTEILHDFPWISPDISSPSRNLRNKRINVAIDGSKKAMNLLFVFGDCPLGNNDLKHFLDKTETSFNCENDLVKDIFSAVLYKEFRNTCSLSFFWIDTGIWCVAPYETKSLIKDWSGYKMMMTTAKKLGGNLIPISSLIQDLDGVFHPFFSPVDQTTPTSDKEVSSEPSIFETVLVPKADKGLSEAFQFSFGCMAKTFLSGSNMAGLNMFTANDFSKENLFHGSLLLKDHKICHISLSPMITEIKQFKSQRHQLSSTSSPGKNYTQTNPNMSKKAPGNSEKSVSVANKSGNESSNGCQGRHDNQISPETKDKDTTKGENGFLIKGVICHQDVSPSLFHPTKLYSCVSYDSYSAVNLETDSKTVTSNSEMLQQFLTMISDKGRNLVMEFCDVETCLPVIGVLQPLTSICAVLSIVKTDRLLMIEKLLLHQRSRGYSLVPRDVIANEGTHVLPVVLHKNITTSDEDGTTAPMSSCQIGDRMRPNSAMSDGKIVKSYIRDIDCKKRKSQRSGKEVYLKLKEYYSEKQKRQSKEREGDVETQQSLQRGKLCQNASHQNKSSVSNENQKGAKNTQFGVEMASEPHGINVDSLDLQQVVDVEVDENCAKLPDIKTIDELRKIVEEDYQKCVNLDQSAAVFSIRTFGLIDKLKSSGELKSSDHVLTLLQSSVLHDNKTLREMIESRERATSKDQITQEYKVQVFLRLELASRYEQMDQENLADEITVMLRAISFQKDPTYLSSFLRNSIIRRYAASLSKLLCLVYDGLMQKPPKEILSPSRVSSEEDTPLKSFKAPSVSSRSESVEEPKISRGLVRRHSIMDVQSKRREIVVPVKGKSTKHRSKEKRQTRSSGKKIPAPRKPITPVKKVRRNLFMKDAEGNERRTSPRKQAKTKTATEDTLKRRHTIASISRLKKVGDTPACKQVSRRMLRRQEWARRRSKIVTDVTVVGESPLKDEEVVRPFPRKSPRRKASTFYSSSSTSTLVAPATSQVAEEMNDMAGSDPKSNRTGNVVKRDRRFSRTLSMTETKSPTSPKGTFKRSLSLKESSSFTTEENVDKESFSEVFLDTNPMESSLDPNGSTRNPIKPSLPSFSTEPQRNTTLATLAQPTTHTFTSSPALSTTSPVASYLSPSQSQRCLSARKQLHSPSPVLFKSPAFKQSIASFSPDQIFDVAIPLTPVKSSTKSKTTCFTPTTSPITPNKNSVSQNSPYMKKRITCDVGRDHSQGYDDKDQSEIIVIATPQLGRRRSLLSKTERKTDSSWSTKQTGNRGNINVANKVTPDKQNSIRSGSGVVCSIVNTSGTNSRPEVWHDDDISLNNQQQSEVFTNHVTTKRKRLTSKREPNLESVSPLNQILKQRKNLRNSPGTSQEIQTKPKTSLRNRKFAETSLPRDDNKKRNLMNKTNRQSSTCVEDHWKDSELLEQQRLANETSNNIRIDRIISPSKTYSPSSCQSPSNKHLFRHLQPHFTPVGLSAGSLKHLEESPVLIGSESLASSSTSHSRKWSERLSPSNPSRKRTRLEL